MGFLEGSTPPQSSPVRSNDWYPGQKHSDSQGYIYNPFSNKDVNDAKATSANAFAQQQSLVDALSGQNGIQNQSQVFGQQQALANQLQGVANGTGPNPVLDQYNQATGQNIASQAALMAGQRGANANVGLLARQIAQQGAATQQQAAGQSAVLQGQQQLGAMSALQQQQQALAQTAGSQVGNQFNAVSGLNQTAQQNQNLANVALNAQNTGNINMQSNINSSQAGVSSANATAQAEAAGGIAKGVGSAISSGAVAAYDGGMISEPNENGPRSHVTHYFNKSKGSLSDHGGQIPGKAPLEGNHPKNDIVHAVLSPKEIVIPRSITMGANAPEKAAQFVAQVLARQKKRA